MCKKLMFLICVVLMLGMFDMASGGSCVQPPVNMEAWWPLDLPEKLGEDIAGSHNGAIVCGNPEPLPGKVDKGCRFNHELWNEGVIRVSNDPFVEIGEGDFTIDAWIYPEYLGSICQILVPNNHCEDRIILDNHGNNRNTNEARVWEGPGVTFFVRNTTPSSPPYPGEPGYLGLAMNTVTFLSSTAPVVLNQWQHVAVRVSRTGGTPTGTFYYNGQAIDTFTPISGSLYQGGLPGWPRLDIGHATPLNCGSCAYTNDYFNGLLDEIEVFKRALDPNEIAAIYNADSAGKCKCKPGPTYSDDIKWSQPPEQDDSGCINGWDEVSNYNTEPIIADDWVCMDERPIKDIHWWGSFRGWTGPNQSPPYDMPRAFHIGIWTDVPKAPANPFSHPGRLIWENICESYVWSYAGCDVDPRTEGENDSCFKFDQLLSQDQWFSQETNEPNGTVYWLSIAAIYDGDTPVHPWGWKTRPHFYNDDALRIFPPVAKCPNSCPGPNLSVFTAGYNDDFNLPAEAAHPSQELIGFIGGTYKNFDETVDNERIGHTFTGLPHCIVAATLEIRMKATGDIPSTDSLSLEVLGGTTPRCAWGKLIEDLPLVPGGAPINQWSIGDTNTFLLDLDNLLPGGNPNITSVLEYMEDGDLDVSIQDDTAVDYMILRVWSCPLVIGQWPPEVGSFWENGQPIEYPTGTSWDMAFVLTTNRTYAPKTGYWPNTPPIPDANRITPYPGQVDFNGDLRIDFKDFSVLAGQWLTEGEVWPEWDMP